jgi:hypothetical protein
MLLQTALIRENEALLSRVQYAPGLNKQLLTTNQFTIYLFCYSEIGHPKLPNLILTAITPSLPTCRRD